MVSSLTTDGHADMLGGDYHRTIRASDGTIPEEDIKRYYNIAMKYRLARRMVFFRRNEGTSKDIWL